ncbi:hypothetical protein F4604DRAFT_1820695 [Suillus subluteus]|nr:hypothetical protein F4604DRAFT_1820695 [Suillus subluteus]
MDDSTPKCNPSPEPCDVEKQQFIDLEKIEEPMPLYLTLFSAVATGSILWYSSVTQLDSPVDVDVPTHDPQTHSLRHTLLRVVFIVGTLLSFCVALLIVLSKILIPRHTLTPILPPDGPRHLHKYRIQCLPAIPASMLMWFMQLLKSLWWIFTLFQLVTTMAVLMIRWLF